MRLMHLLMLLSVVQKGRAFLHIAKISSHQRFLPSALLMSTSAGTTDLVLSWTDLQTKIGETAVGTALNIETHIRLQGKGSAHVQNKLRKFDSNDEPAITLFRDHAGW
jgi:hypothetical protein